MACKWDIRFSMYVLGAAWCQKIHRSWIPSSVLSVISVHKEVGEEKFNTWMDTIPQPLDYKACALPLCYNHGPCREKKLPTSWTTKTAKWRHSSDLALFLWSAKKTSLYILLKIAKPSFFDFRFQPVVDFFKTPLILVSTFWSFLISIKYFPQFIFIDCPGLEEYLGFFVFRL